MRLLLLIAVHWSFLAGLPLANGDDNDDAILELTEIQEERRKAVEKLNRFNPLSESFARAGAGAGILSSQSPPALLAVRQLFTQENRKLFAIVEGGWIFLVFCLQVFRSGRSAPFWKRAFELLWIIVLFWSIALVVIPLFTLGTNALTVLKDLGIEFAGAL